MKRYLTIVLALVLSLGGAALKADEKKPKTKAQALVERSIARYPSVMILGLHAVAPGATDSTIIASNKGSIGKKDDPDDLEAFHTNKEVLGPDEKKNVYEVLVPMRDKTGKPIGTLVCVYSWHGEKIKQYSETTAKIRDELQKEIASLDDLFSPAGENPPLLVAGETITIPNDKGSFDFLEVDTLNHRLLAPHEKSGTMDFIDLDSNQLITRVETGPAVDCFLAKNNKYYVSDSEDKKVSVLDGDTFKLLKDIPLPGELDLMAFDSKNGYVYVTNDEGTHLWGIDPETDTVAADITVPGAPEGLVYDAATDRIYLSSKPTDEIVVIDPNSNKITAHWPTAVAPHGLAFDPVSKRLFSAGGKGKMAVIDATNGKLIASVDIAPGADQATYDPALRRVYVATGPLLSVVQETDDGAEFLGNVDVGPFPRAKDVTIDVSTRLVWMAYSDGKNAYIKSWHLPR